MRGFNSEQTSTGGFPRSVAPLPLQRLRVFGGVNEQLPHHGVDARQLGLHLKHPRRLRTQLLNTVRATQAPARPLSAHSLSDMHFHTRAFTDTLYNDIIYYNFKFLNLCFFFRSVISLACIYYSAFNGKGLNEKYKQKKTAGIVRECFLS